MNDCEEVLAALGEIVKAIDDGKNPASITGVGAFFTHLDIVRWRRVYEAAVERRKAQAADGP